MKVKIIRPIVGILLILLSIMGLFWWENVGRENFMMESIMVAKNDIKIGSIISEKDFIEIKNITENTISGAITPQNFYKVKGLISKQFIPKLGQVNCKMFTEKEEVLSKEDSIFPIKEIWIDSRSSSIRKGDMIDVFDNKGELYVGTFKIAYVKDSNEQEVVGTEENVCEEILQRNFSSSMVAYVEIIASLDEYKKIWKLAEEEDMKFLLIQKGESIYG